MNFTPIPLPADWEGAAGIRNLPRFMPAIPMAPDSMPEDWFTPLVDYAPVPSASGIFDLQPLVRPIQPIASIPVQQGGYAPQQPLPVAEIVLPSDIPVAFQAPGGNAFPKEEAPLAKPAEYSDEDLAEAFAPILQAAVRRAVFESESNRIDAFLEPMLRATVRRALAEYHPASRPFRAPGFLDRTVWRLQALFSSRTYEDVLFERTHRFQVEEVFLFDAETLALVSFASSDPARHSSAKRVEASAHRIAMQIRDEEGVMLRSFEQADGRNVIAEVGEYMTLVAVVRGTPNELMLADLGFSLHRIEVHFRERFQQAGSALMHALQPFLEDCLLIQAPASAA